MYEVKMNYLIFRQWMIRKYPKIVCNLLRVTLCIGAFCFTFGFMIAVGLEWTNFQVVAVLISGVLLGLPSGVALDLLIEGKSDLELFKVEWPNYKNYRFKECK